MDNSEKAIGWLNRSKLSSNEAEHDFGVHALRGPSGALPFVNQRRADYLGLPKGHPLAALEKAIVGNACARAVDVARALWTAA